MATQTIEFYASVGISSVKLYAIGSDVVVASVVPAGQANPNIWRGVFTDIPAGHYQLRPFIGTAVMGFQYVTLTLTTATFIAYELPGSLFVVPSGGVSAAVASSGIDATITGMPTFLRQGDARTVSNGYAIPIRMYDAATNALMFGIGTRLFADAVITFSLRRPWVSGVEEAEITCTWVASGSDGYVQVAYEAAALASCVAMDVLKEKENHRWGVKFQWGTADPITLLFGRIPVVSQICSTQ